MPDDTNHHFCPDDAFRLNRRGNVQYLECQAFEECGFITHAFCTRWGGVSEGRLADFNFGIQVGDRKEYLAHNRELLRIAFGLPGDNPVTVSQVHGDRLLVIDETPYGTEQTTPLEYDGIITAAKGIAVGIKTADCVPILIADRKRQVIGAIHAGWKGTARGIAAKAIERLTRSFASVPDDIIVAIGPAIGPCCYEVDEPVLRAFDNTPGQEHAFTQGRKKGRWMCDLTAANRLQLINAGIPPENVLTADMCTSCRQDIFYSHRGEKGGTGRQISFIMVQEVSVL